MAFGEKLADETMIVSNSSRVKEMCRADRRKYTPSDTVFGIHPVMRLQAHSQAWQEITPTYNTLADYNNGLLCAPPR
jgi:hypothetical protein